MAVGRACRRQEHLSILRDAAPCSVTSGTGGRHPDGRRARCSRTSRQRSCTLAGLPVGAGFAVEVVQSSRPWHRAGADPVVAGRRSVALHTSFRFGVTDDVVGVEIGVAALRTSSPSRSGRPTALATTPGLRRRSPAGHAEGSPTSAAARRGNPPRPRRAGWAGDPVRRAPRCACATTGWAALAGAADSDDIQGRTRQVAEGVPNARSVREPARLQRRRHADHRDRPSPVGEGLTPADIVSSYRGGRLLRS